jgi:hypothetical protein
MPNSGRIRNACWLEPVRCALAAAVLTAFTACALPPRLPAVPQASTTMATISGIPNARFFPDTQIDLLAKEAFAAREREIATLKAGGYDGPLPVANLLAVSGGGDIGAFGAGLLVG